MPKGVYQKRSELQKETCRKLGFSRKGITPYVRTQETNKKISNSLKGRIPVNKGVQSEKTLKKLEKLKLGSPIECKMHGEHLKWRLHSDNNVQCLKCAAKWQRERKKRMPFRVIFNSAKRHAKDKNREFSILYEDLIDLNEKQEGKCALSRIKFDDENLPSLDRINSCSGYTKENIQLVLIKINRMKTDISQEEFIDICEKIYKARKGKK